VKSPGRILVAGDWHGNTRWALNVIWQSKALLEDEELKVILQVGDLGVWAGEFGEGYLEQLQLALGQAEAHLLFPPGNHEDYDELARWREEGYPELASFMPLVNGQRLNRIHVLPRGHRWEWQGRTWLACGGAASPDRAWREARQAATGTQLWWPGEYITGADIERCVEHGPAAVLVSHDRPERARISLPPWNALWADADRARCDASRERLQRICDGTRPAHVIHGHYHQPFSCEQHDLGYGPVSVSQLGMDGSIENYRVLNVKDMTWA